ncbi:MAG: DUF4190 domain-containing protein [Limisphaerales bacterium]
MYKIVGADGRVYGPVSAEQIKQWIAEGRANAQSQALADGAAAWKPLVMFPEFAGFFAPQVPPTIPLLVAPAPRRISGAATAGLIFGILSVVCCCKFLFCILGIVFSLIGLSQISHHPALYEGRSMAIIGLVLSILGALFAVILIGFALASGNLQYHWAMHRF